MRHRSPLPPLNDSCQDGTKESQIECAHLWPRYPCYDNETGSCSSLQGTILVDPFNDLLQILVKLVTYIVNTLRKIYTGRDISEETREMSDGQFSYEWANWGSTIISNFIPARIDIARFVDVSKLQEFENKINKTIKNIINKKLKQEGGSPMYNYIVNPKTGKKVSIYGKTGGQILKKYINYIKHS